MIAVIFEVWPKADRKQDYLRIAAELKPLLEKIDGFISIERFESLYEPGKILSLSFFRNEAAVQAWRTTNDHRAPEERRAREACRSRDSASAESCCPHGPQSGDRRADSDQGFKESGVPRRQGTEGSDLIAASNRCGSSRSL